MAISITLSLVRTRFRLIQDGKTCEFSTSIRLKIVGYGDRLTLATLDGFHWIDVNLKTTRVEIDMEGE